MYKVFGLGVVEKLILWIWVKLLKWAPLRRLVGPRKWMDSGLWDKICHLELGTKQNKWKWLTFVFNFFINNNGQDLIIASLGLISSHSHLALIGHQRPEYLHVSAPQDIVSNLELNFLENIFKKKKKNSPNEEIKELDLISK